MYGGPQQPAFINSISNLTGIVHASDFNGGNTNNVAYNPDVGVTPSSFFSFFSDQNSIIEH